MRLWHYDTLDVLPNKQLLSQWRECAAIAGSIKKNGTPNHLLVNKVLDYPWTEFTKYTALVMDELVSRDYNINNGVWFRIKQICEDIDWQGTIKTDDVCELYPGWHNERYLKQCLMNLEEKRDSGGISNSEWLKILNKYINYLTY